ncbi:MAG: dihydroorotase [Thermodesulfobacteriota bacterium]|jgi:dihydroorotase
MKFLIKKASLVTGELGAPRVSDVLIDDGKISEIAENIIAPEAAAIDASGRVLVPGLVDAHVHFREPGQEYKEDLYTGSSAAAAGGFTTAIAEPNTVPPIDTPARLRRLLNIAEQKSVINFYSKSAITKGTMGYRLTDIAKLKEAGARAISDDGNPVPSRRLMRSALVKGKECGILVSPHCEESAFYRQRVLSSFPRMPYAPPGANPYTSEAGFIERDIELAEKTGARLHLSHVSLARSVEIIADAKKRGVNVTAEATPQHLLLTEKMAKEIGPNAKVNPPLRSEDDVEALRAGLANGTIDIIASDHAPHSPEEKNQSWDQAPFGVIGLETTLGLVLTYLVHPGILTLKQAIEKMTVTPAKIFGLDVLGVGCLSPGVKADLTLIDLDRKWKVDANSFYSKGRNCPFNGWELQGKAILTIVAGRVIAKDGVVI